LKDALAKGKGVLALSAHLGSFTMIGARLAAEGYPFSAVVKQPRDQRFARLIDAYREQIGIQTISAKPRTEAVRGILKALRKNRIVLMIADEFKSGGVMVDFMGQTSAAPRGPATLALRTGAVTLPMFAARRADGSLVLSIGAELKPVRMEDLEESVEATTALYTRHLENTIREYPDQWNWLDFGGDQSQIVAFPSFDKFGTELRWRSDPRSVPIACALGERDGVGDRGRRWCSSRGLIAFIVEEQMNKVGRIL